MRANHIKALYKGFLTVLRELHRYQSLPNCDKAEAQSAKLLKSGKQGMQQISDGAIEVQQRGDLKNKKTPQ